jgi:ubiquinone/menaquinone biosynthesis C-methylase UbiE
MDSESRIWNSLFSSGEFLWKEPHELVTELLPTLKKLSGKRVLDLGCGAGRHLIFLSENGFICHGTDHAFAGLESARDWLADRGFEGNLSQNKMYQLPYATRSFEAVVCLFVIYHGTVIQIERAFKEIYRILKLDGLAVVTFISDKHHRFGNGVEIEPHTFITKIGADAGIPHHFNDEGEMLWMIKDFELLEFNPLEQVNEDGFKESHWAMLLRKASG